MSNQTRTPVQFFTRRHEIVENRPHIHPNILYPSAPRILPKELPSEGEASQPQRKITIDRGDGQLLPTALLFRDNLLPGIDTRLGFQERPRAVVHPTLTFMPEFPEYLWGAVRGYVTARHVGVRVHFEEIAEPATDPPVSVMRITTAFGGWFVAEPQDGSLYVTVADAQRAVIRWMKETRTRPSLNEPNPRLSRWVRLTDDDGTELEVEVWVWRGLTPLPASMENWVLHLERPE